MPGANSIGEIDDAVDREQPHAGKMPLQGAGKPILVVKVDRAVETAPERERDRKTEWKKRFGIVDAPSAHNHDDHGERIEPMGDPHRQRMHYDLGHASQSSRSDVGHHCLPALASSMGCSPADWNAAFAGADCRKARNGCVSMTGSRACA